MKLFLTFRAQWRIWTLRVLLLGFIFLLNMKPAAGFGKGPFSHAVITRLALEQYTIETNWELETSCAQVLIQSSIVSDNANFGSKDTYHCDNNNLQGCSWRLDQLKGEARKDPVALKSLQKMGQALHIIQDFYAHSNWAEIFQTSGIQAPLETFKDVPPPLDVQSGYFPDLFLPSVETQVLCYTAPQEEWGKFILGATHDCINKDSSTTKRGAQWVPNTIGLTYHELAARYAVKHSVDALKEFARVNPHFITCLKPLPLTFGCNNFINKVIERNTR